MSNFRARTQKGMATMWPFLVMGYVAAILAIDTLATECVEWPWDWGKWFMWSSRDVHAALTWGGCPDWIATPLTARGMGSFDWFKFLLWFAFPFLFALRRMDWGAIGPRRWKRIDIALPLGIAVIGVLVMMLIPYVPALHRTYPTLMARSPEMKLAFCIWQLAWLASWLPGWEFMHRYTLLRAANQRWPRYGWLLLPLFEGVYHLQKPMLEMLGMVLFSIAMTQWTLRRRNILLPFLCHLIIEAELVIYLVYR